MTVCCKHELAGGGGTRPEAGARASEPHHQHRSVQFVQSIANGGARTCQLVDYGRTPVHVTLSPTVGITCTVDFKVYMYCTV